MRFHYWLCLSLLAGPHHDHLDTGSGGGAGGRAGRGRQ